MRDASSKSMPSCFFWFDRSLAESHSKRMALYVMYNIIERGTEPARKEVAAGIFEDGCLALAPNRQKRLAQVMREEAVDCG